MSTVKGIPPRVTPPISQEPGEPPASAKRSGRPTFDSRGNAVWEWKTEEEGKFSVDVSTQRLKKLEAPELSLDETVRIKKLGGLGLREDTLPGGGFNPYDRAKPADKRAAWPNAPAVPQKNPPPTQDARKPVKDLKRLQEWMEMKKRLASQKDDD